MKKILKKALKPQKSFEEWVKGQWARQKNKSVSEEIRQRTCCFVGHQKISMNERELIFKTTMLIIKAIEEGYIYFISDCAAGFDMIAADLIAFFNDSGYDIKLEIAIPYGNNNSKYSKQQEEYYNLYNEYIVNKASFIIAYYEHEKNDGTKNKLDYAKNLDREIWFV